MRVEKDERGLPFSPVENNGLDQGRTLGSYNRWGRLAGRGAHDHPRDRTCQRPHGVGGSCEYDQADISARLSNGILPVPDGSCRRAYLELFDDGLERPERLSRKSLGVRHPDRGTAWSGVDVISFRY